LLWMVLSDCSSCPKRATETSLLLYCGIIVIDFDCVIV
jgi:hypothetical protein